MNNVELIGELLYIHYPSGSNGDYLKKQLRFVQEVNWLLNMMTKEQCENFLMEQKKIDNGI